jgi:hypothetical protein
LKNESETAELGTLAEQIAAWENDTEPAQVTSTQRKRVYTALQQQHLPVMDDRGIVEFDDDRGLIEPTPALEDMEVYIDVVQGNDIPWSEFYLGLSAVFGLLTAAVWLNVWPFTNLVGEAVGAFISVALACSALVHRYAQHRQLGQGSKPPEVEQ